MKSKRNKLFIFAMALMMFTSTWAGAFAAEPEQSEEPAGNDVKAAVEEQNVTGDPEPPQEDTNKIEDLKATLGDDGTSVVLSWKAIEGATYTAKAFVLDKEVASKTPTDATETFSDLEKGKEYTFKVTATVAGETPVVYTGEITKGIPAEAPGAIDKNSIKSLAGCKMVRLTWDDVEDADGYVIKRFTNGVQDKDLHFKKSELPNAYMSIKNGVVSWNNTVGVEIGQVYSYKLFAAKNTGMGETEGLSTAVDAQGFCVQPMNITFKFKKSRTLKSRTGGSVKTKFAKNQQVTATGYGGGCYYFNYGGRGYRVSRTSAKKAVAHYNGRGNWDYSPKEAELFVNGCGLGSSTNYFIWVSFYTQRLYVFDRGGSEFGTWRCIANWDCATGKAGTPSPTGVKAIGKFHKKSHHGIKWWSGFSGGNSIHGKKASWKLGLPQSHGCIRNDVSNAKWVFDNCKKNTRVYNY